MKLSLTTKFILLIMGPIILTAIVVIFIEYQIIDRVLMRWEALATAEFQDAEQQRLHNYVLVNKMIIENQFRGISQGFHVLKSIVEKFDTNQVISTSIDPVECSMRLYDLGLCEKYKYDEQKKNLMYLDQWFHVNLYKIQDLSDSQVKQLYNNLSFMFYAKAISTAKQNDLVDLSLLSTAYPDSMVVITPSRYSNYADSSRDTCNGTNNLEAYDPRCRSWYLSSIKTSDLVFTAPFLKATSNIIGFIGNQRIDKSDGTFLAFFNNNIGIENLKSKIFANQDNRDETSLQEAYTVLIHKDYQTVYHHRNWLPNSGVLKSWVDIEYNSTTFYHASDKVHFNSEVDRISHFAQNGLFNVNQRINTTSLYFSFKRQNKTYLALLYPVELLCLRSTVDRTYIIKKPMLIGRVQKDRTMIFYDITLGFMPVISTIMKVEVGVVIFWALINAAHFFAVLYVTQDKPLQDLTVAIQHQTSTTKHYQSSANNNAIHTNAVTQTNTYNKSVKTNENIRPVRISNNETTMQPLNQNNNSFKSYAGGWKPHGRTSTLNNTIPNAINFQSTMAMNNARVPSTAVMVDSKQQLGPSQHSFFSTLFKSGVIPRKLSRHSTDFSAASQAKKKQPMLIKHVDPSFLELGVIIESIEGIFNLLKLAQITSQDGNVDLSIQYFAQAARVFMQVKNKSQEISCLKSMGILYMRSSRFIDAAECFERGVALVNFPMNWIMQPENEHFADYTHMLRLLATSYKNQSQLERDHHRKQQMLQQGMSYINVCILLLKSHWIDKNVKQNQFALFLSEQIRIDIISNGYHSYMDAIKECITLEKEIANYQSRLSVALPIQFQVLLQNMNVIKAFCLSKMHCAVEACEVLIEQLHLSNNLDESVKHASLVFLNAAFKQPPFASKQKHHKKKNIFENHQQYFRFIEEETEKYSNKSECRVKVLFIIELSCSISGQYTLEEQIKEIYRVFQSLQKGDVSEFWVISQGILHVVCHEFHVGVSSDEFVSYCIRDIRKIFGESVEEYQMEFKASSSVSRRLDWIQQAQSMLILSNIKAANAMHEVVSHSLVVCFIDKQTSFDFEPTEYERMWETFLDQENACSTQQTSVFLVQLDETNRSFEEFNLIKRDHSHQQQVSSPLASVASRAGGRTFHSRTNFKSERHGLLDYEEKVDCEFDIFSQRHNHYDEAHELLSAKKNRNQLTPPQPDYLLQPIMQRKHSLQLNHQPSLRQQRISDTTSMHQQFDQEQQQQQQKQHNLHVQKQQHHSQSEQQSTFYFCSSMEGFHEYLARLRYRKPVFNQLDIL